MRVCLFDPLPSDLNYLILKWFTPLDLALARVVCKGWSQEIGPQRLTFSDGFTNIPIHYDRQEYVLEMERCITFPQSLYNVWRSVACKNTITESCWIHFALFFSRKTGTNIGLESTIQKCYRKESLWYSILLPLFSVHSEDSPLMFWHAIIQEDIYFLVWVVKNFFTNVMHYTERVLPFSYFTDSRLEFLRHVKTKEILPAEFWPRLVKHLHWKSPGYGSKFRTIFEVCNFVPYGGCEALDYTDHESILHLCGCERILSFKKRKKE